METGYLLVIGLRDSPQKEGSGRSAARLHNHYVNHLHELTRGVHQTFSQLSSLGWLPPGAVASC